MLEILDFLELFQGEVEGGLSEFHALEFTNHFKLLGKSKEVTECLELRRTLGIVRELESMRRESYERCAIGQSVRVELHMRFLSHRLTIIGTTI